MNGDGILDMMAIQGFARIFPLYEKLPVEAQAVVKETVVLLHKKGIDQETWQGALSTLSDVFFPSHKEMEESIQISRKREEESDTPCEYCKKTPTHLVKFSQGNRTEEHYFCEGCEGEAIDANEEG